MPKRAVFSLLLACAACAGDGAQPQAAGSALCTRGPANLDLGAGTWRVLKAPHGANEFGLPMQIDAVLDACDAIVSVAHDTGAGGKALINGPGKLLWSTDGNSWQPRDMLSSAYFHDVARGEGVWVAAGSERASGVIAISTQADASEWRQVFTHTDHFLAVAYGGGRFVAVTQRGVAVSSDGAQWSWATIPGVQALYFDVAYGAGRFVVAGVGATLSSADAQRWEEVTCPGGCPVIETPSGPAPALIALQRVDYIDGFFYGSGASGYLRSSDGTGFTRFTGERLPVAAISGRLISFDSVPIATPSPSPVLSESLDDGQTWTPLPLEAIVDRADCTSDLCLAVGDALLVFHPAR